MRRLPAIAALLATAAAAAHAQQAPPPAPGPQQPAPPPAQAEPAKPAPRPVAPVAEEPPAAPDERFVYEKLLFAKDGKESHAYRVGHEFQKEIGDPILKKVMEYHGVSDVKVDYSEPRHLVILTGPTTSVAKVREILAKLNAPDDQVEIEALIVEEELGSGLQTGFESFWDRKTSERTFFRGYDADYNPDDYLNATASRPYQGTTATFDTKGSADTQKRVGDLNLALRALSKRSTVEVIARPKALVSNGGKATFSSGVQILVPTSADLTPTGLSIQRLALQPVLTKLVVTPHIVGHDTVQLHVHVTVDEVVREDPVEISKREIETDVILKGEDLLTLGGLHRRKSVVQERGIPLLSDIPILGYLFKSYNRSTTKTRLDIHLGVRIVRFDRPETWPTMPRAAADAWK